MGNPYALVNHEGSVDVEYEVNGEPYKFKFVEVPLDLSLSVPDTINTVLFFVNASNAASYENTYQFFEYMNPDAFSGNYDVYVIKSFCDI